MLNNGMCDKCYATIYFEKCEDYDREYCEKYMRNLNNSQTLIEEVKI